MVQGAPIRTAFNNDILEGTTMNKLFATFAAAGLAATLFATAGSAATLAPSQQSPSQGVVIVPASASPYESEAAAPKFKRGKVVAFETQAAAGSIIVNTRQNRLYYVLGNGQALMFRVATAKRGFEWKGTHKVSSKAKWPSWSPPAEMRKRRPDLPTFMAGGPENPLGARALYLGSSIYRIHGTNEPSSIGKAASSGCIRMHNEDVTYLYGLVKLGARVTVI
jgi:lipoprotein-anchoring transpeptidase ErfK/SrfK